MHTPTHPDAVVAVFLASRDGMSRDHISREHAITRTPRSLYTLARVLRSAQIMDEINAAPLKPKPTRFVYDPNFLGTGLAGLRQVHGEAA